MGPILNPSQSKTSESRQQKRDERKQARQDKLQGKVNATISDEMSRFGIDLSKSPSLSESEKSNISSTLSGNVADDVVKGMQKWESIYPAAPQQDLPQINRKQLEESVVRQRKSRWADALTNLGRGMSGKGVDWNNQLADKEKNERTKQYEEYKSVVQGNQKVRSAWEAQKYKEALAYLDKLELEAKNEPLRLQQIEVARQQLLNSQQQYRLNEDSSKLQREEFEARKKGGYYDYRDRRTSSGAGNHYEKITLPAAQERIINDVITLGSGDKASAAYSNRIRESIIRSLYDETTDASGKTTFTPKPGAEAKIKSLADKTKQLNTMKVRLDALEKSLENSLNPDPAEQQELKTLKEKVPALQDELFQLIDDTGSPAASGKTPFEAALEAANSKK